MDVVFAAAAMHSCKDVSRGIPTPHSHATRVYVSEIRYRLLGPGCVKRREKERGRECCRPVVVGEIEAAAAAAARGSGSPASSDADAG